MDPRTGWKLWAKLFNPKNNEVVESPELYLKLTTRCMKQVDRVFGLHGASLLKFNQEQCRYLVEKLELTLQNANLVIEQVNHEFNSLASPEDMEQLLLVFKLLYAMGKEIEDFIQDCCKETWIHSAIMLTNVSERVVTVGFNLECCSIVFTRRNLGTLASLELCEIASLRKSEAEVVRERANYDKTNMMGDLKVVFDSSAISSAEHELAFYILGRLETTTYVPANLFGSNERSILNMQGKLGVGSSAIVHKATWCGLEVAKKSFHGPENKDFLQEVKLLEGLSHPNIVSLLWYMIDARRCHLIMELMDGDLNHLIQEKMEENENKGYPFNIHEALDIMLQIAEGMLFLHEKGIVHRDLKSSNILVRSKKVKEVDINYLQAKVADFGLAQTKEINMSYSNLTPNVGTTRWMAPEVIEIGSDDFERKVGSKYPFKVDIYSYGMVCYEILSGNVPFSTLNNGDAKKAVLAGERPPVPNACPQKLKSLIEACWKSEASTRPCFGDICEELRAMKFSNIHKYWVENISKCSEEDKVKIVKSIAKLSNLAKMQHSVLLDGKGLIKVPDGFKCPISLQLMRDPVIIASGETYERSCIQKWLANGNNTCPKTGLLLSHTNLTSNHVLQRMIVEWYALDYITKLSSAIAKAQRSAAYDIRLLSRDDDNRRIYIAEQGAIPLLVALLLSPDEKTQFQAVTALHNLSINGDIKGRIVAAGAIELVVEVLKSGCMEARENAAATLFNLSLADENKFRIVRSGAIPALVTLLQDGTARGKKDAATALFILAIYYGDKVRVVQAGMMPQLIRLIADQPTTMLNEALMNLARIAKNEKNCAMIGAVGPTSIWVNIIVSESPQNKENAATILLALCSHDVGYIRQVRELNAIEPLIGMALSRESTDRAKRKASALLELLKEPAPPPFLSSCRNWSHHPF